MGSILEFNDTLKIRSELLPDTLKEGGEYSFRLAGRRIFHLPPVRVFLVEEIDSNWNYIGHAQITRQTIDAVENVTLGRFLVTKLYSEAYLTQVNLNEPPQGKSYQGPSRRSGESSGQRTKGIVIDPQHFMQAAIDEARVGERENGIPIGAVLVESGQIIGRGHNKRVQDNDPIMHAEIDCLRNAGRIRTYTGSTLFSTLMPCYLCAGAIVQFGIKNVFVGEAETFTGAKEFMESHGAHVEVLDLNECKEMMKRFVSKQPELWQEDIGGAAPDGRENSKQPRDR